MGNVILDLAISLDGFVGTTAGEDGGLHGYFFSPSEATAAVIQSGIAETGAIIMGRRTYDLGAKYNGFVGSPYDAANFVVTHAAPLAVAAGAEAFVFVTDGIESALRRAQAAAGTRAVIIGGGADLARQFLAAGLVDELYLHTVPKFLGDGLPLIDATLAARLKLTLKQATTAPDALHLRYHIEK